MFNRKCLLLGVLLLAGLVVGPNPLGADSEGVQSGPVYAAWDLPASEREPGWAAGYLYTPRFTEQYVFLAELQERPSPTNTRVGPIYGLLYDFRDPTYQRPLYYVDGTWQGPRNATTGTWSATIYSLRTFEVVGRMSGRFNDPAPFELGRYGLAEGNWQISE